MGAAVEPNVTIDDWDKLDVRVGLIERVEDVRGSKKLVALHVDFGDFKRTILTGMREEREDCKAIEGTKTLFLVNMAPRKMAGMVSEGMLLDIGYEDGIPSVLATLERDVPAGTRLC
ncbi:tRNA-binding protein [Olsenella sp. DNF00959]|uniref:tRNA-binding protein n=1 Tax=Olsenella sp. DNF00959 TaxID=1476999 RepID=UPI00078661D3|nr:tRNA-binding protein [Olsenella sp. DNF00959]KXB63823.1 putative methionine--tRNA ligase, beta subunit [Olsenella sp. DNF00959]